jgi:hypothetical protein
MRPGGALCLPRSQGRTLDKPARRWETGACGLSASQIGEIPQAIPAASLRASARRLLIGARVIT